MQHRKPEMKNYFHTTQVIILFHWIYRKTLIENIREGKMVLMIRAVKVEAFTLMLKRSQFLPLLYVLLLHPCLCC